MLDRGTARVRAKKLRGESVAKERALQVVVGRSRVARCENSLGKGGGVKVFGVPSFFIP